MGRSSQEESSPNCALFTSKMSQSGWAPEVWTNTGSWALLCLTAFFPLAASLSAAQEVCRDLRTLHVLTESSGFPETPIRRNNNIPTIVVSGTTTEPINTYARLGPLRHVLKPSMGMGDRNLLMAESSTSWLALQALFCLSQVHHPAPYLWHHLFSTWNICFFPDEKPIASFT